MARKKKFKIPSWVIKYSFIVVIVFGLGFGISKLILNYLMHSDHFKVETVVLDPSLDFISRNDVENLKGKSIFEVDLKKLQSRIEYRYPEVSELRIMRRFPDEILIMAKKRLPFIQVKFRNTLLTLDDRGVVLESDSKRNGHIPIIDDIKFENISVSLGHTLRSKKVYVALDVLKYFYSETKLSSYTVDRIMANDIYEVHLILSDGLNIVLSSKQIFRQIQNLGIVLSRNEINPKEVLYIDLRYKEPILKKK